MGRRPKRETDPARRRALDIAFEPLLNFGGKGKKTALSLHEILLRQTFKSALDGECKAARTMLKMAREHDRARTEHFQLARRKLVLENNEQVSADPAMQLLDILRATDDRPFARLGIAPWVIECAFARFGCLNASDWKRTVPHLWQDGLHERVSYRLEDDPLYVVPNPKRSPESTRFRKGESGNPRGRPPREKVHWPFGNFFEELLPMKIGDEIRQVTRIEGLIYQLGLKAAKGDKAIAQVLQSAANAALLERWNGKEHETVRLVYGLHEDTTCRLSSLKRLRLINRRARRHILLHSWIVQEAVNRLADDALGEGEQAVVVRATSTPEKVQWPAWWAPHLRRKPRRQSGEPRIATVNYRTSGEW